MRLSDVSWWVARLCCLKYTKKRRKNSDFFVLHSLLDFFGREVEEILLD